jgi:hypothetical protein
VAFQFAHISTFSRKGNSTSRTVSDVAKEAARIEGHAPHVDTPAPPVIIFGMNPVDIPDEIESRIHASKSALRGSGRSPVRRDTHVLEGMVFSHPCYCQPSPIGLPSLGDATVREEYLAWRTATIDWAHANSAKRGLEILSIVEHLDEGHPHIHVLSIARNDRLDAKAAHPGHVAKNMAVAVGESPAMANRKYKEAMREWQDEYHVAVGEPHGLARLGPAKRRLSRSQWQTEKAEALRRAKRLKAIDSAERKSREAVHAAYVSASTIEDRAHQKDKVSSAMVEGLEAWGDGRLIGPAPDGPDGEKRLIFLNADEAHKSGLVSRLTPAWNWLHEWTGRANAAVARTVQTIIIAAQAWAEGFLLRRGSPRGDGRPSLIMSQSHPDGLVDQLDSCREIVADLLDRLPDRERIWRAAQLAEQVMPYLPNAQQDAARRLKSDLVRASGAKVAREEGRTHG